MKIDRKQIENFLLEKDIIVKNEIFKEEEKDVYSLFLEGLIEEEALEKTAFEKMKDDLNKLTILEKLKTNVIKEFKFSQIARSEFNEVVDYYLRNALKNLKKKENLSNKFSSGDEEIDLNELNLIDEEEVSFTENDDPFTIEVKKSKLIAKAIDKTYNQLSKNKNLDNVLSTAVAGVRTISSLVTGFLRFTGSLLTAAADTIGIGPVVDTILGPSVDLATTFSNVFTETVAAVLGKTEYVDGVSETPFGEKQELSWKTFISKHVKKDQNISFEQITPYDEIGTSPIILGLPPKFMKSADPNNRTFINTFMKDGVFASFIPGKPKYNGSINKSLTEDFSVEAFKNDAGKLSSWTERWETFKQKGKNLWDNAFGNNPNSNPKNTLALKFLKENGISSEFNSLDKRYYSFEADYIDYYSYLETMLNTVYVKMGLANSKEDKLKLFSFFDHSSNFASASLKAQYNNKSIGFYCNGKPSVDDNVSNSITSPDTADQINQTASEFQKLNYLTGFGAGTKKKSRD